MRFSISEVLTFLRCRRMWDYASFNRQGLEKIRRPEHFWLGTGIHFALEQYALGHNPVDAFENWSNEAIALDKAEYAKHVGVNPSPNEFTGYINQKALGLAMIEHYVEHWGSPIPQGFEYVEPELTLVAPIPNTPHELVLTPDGLLAKRQYDEAGNVTGELFYVLDHKTYKQKPKEEVMRRSMQFIAYIWGTRAALRKRCVGIIYDGLLKKVAEEPRLLTTGKLGSSTTTTAALLERAIRRHNLPRELYANRISQLIEDGNPFFIRFPIIRSDIEIQSFEKHLANIVCEMAGDPIIYPNIQWQGCWDCTFTDICTAQESDEDYEYIVEHTYRQREPLEGYIKEEKQREWD